MSDDENEFATEAVGDKMYPMQCSALRKGGFVVIKDRPCKVVDMSTSKTGKHGHAKVNLVGIDIFTGKKYEDLSPSTHNVMVPHVARDEYQLLDIEDGFLSLMTGNGETKSDVRVPEGDVGNDLQAAWAKMQEEKSEKIMLITVLKSMGEEAAISFKESSV